MNLQNNAEPDDVLLYMVVGWHALTLPQVPAELAASRSDMLAVLLAIGLDPKRSIMFHQDNVRVGAYMLKVVANLFAESRSRRTGVDIQLHDFDGHAPSHDNMEGMFNPSRDEPCHPYGACSLVWRRLKTCQTMHKWTKAL